MDLKTPVTTHIEVNQDTRPGVIQVDREEPVTTQHDVKQDTTPGVIQVDRTEPVTTHLDFNQETTPDVIQVDREEPVTTHIDVKQCTNLGEEEVLGCKKSLKEILNDVMLECKVSISGIQFILGKFSLNLSLK